MCMRNIPQVITAFQQFDYGLLHIMKDCYILKCGMCIITTSLYFVLAQVPGYYFIIKKCRLAKCHLPSFGMLPAFC